MKISVVIPAYNEEKLLGKCLKSLKNQTEKPFEIIVVDNNSTDKTAEIAKKMGARVIEEKQQGISFSRNAGFDAAKGGIIARIDADTTAPTNWLERIKKDIEVDGYDVVFGPAYYLDLPKQIQISHLPAIVFFEAINALWKHHMLLGLNMALTKTAWKKVRKEVCMDNKLVHEDLDIGIHLWKYAKIKFDKNLLVTSSIRRFKSPQSQLEYTQRFFKTLKSHDLIHLPHFHT
jgi:glycosyltransferase involved in cell wall biosynthesis